MYKKLLKFTSKLCWKIGLEHLSIKLLLKTFDEGAERPKVHIKHTTGTHIVQHESATSEGHRHACGIDVN